MFCMASLWETWTIQSGIGNSNLCSFYTDGPADRPTDYEIEIKIKGITISI